MVSGTRKHTPTPFIGGGEKRRETEDQLDRGAHGFGDSNPVFGLGDICEDGADSDDVDVA